MIVSETILISKFNESEEKAYEYLIDNAANERQVGELVRLKELCLGNVKKYDYTSYRQDRNKTLLNKMGIDMNKLGISKTIKYNYIEPSAVFNKSDLSIVYLGEYDSSKIVCNDAYEKYKTLNLEDMAKDLHCVRLPSNEVISEIQIDNNKLVDYLSKE